MANLIVLHRNDRSGAVDGQWWAHAVHPLNSFWLTVRARSADEALRKAMTRS
jgi:hypothetical protein